MYFRLVGTRFSFQSQPHVSSRNPDKMEESSSSSGRDQQSTRPNAEPGAGRVSESSRSSPPSRQRRSVPDVDSEADSDDDARGLITQLIENIGSELFEQVNEIDPSICPPCVNIICAFSEGMEPIRTPGKASISMLMHHRSMKALSECSMTCQMCQILIHLLKAGGSDAAVLGQNLSANERKLVRLLERDRGIFDHTITAPEAGWWAMRPWMVVLYSTTALYEMRNGQPGNLVVPTMEEDVHFELPMERANVLGRWARAMILGHDGDHLSRESPLARSSSSSSEIEASQDDIKKVERPSDESQETSNSSSTVDPEPVGEAPTPSSEGLARSEYLAARSISRHVDRILELQSAVWSLNKRYMFHSLGYSLREVRGYKGQTVELQLAYAKSRYPARVFTNKDDQMSGKNLGRPVFHNAKSPETLELMTSWFSNCLENHPECSWSRGNSDTDPILPSRVIDLGESSSPGFVPRLISPGHKRGKWATLSHRWGHGDILKTVSRNVEELEAGINVSKLPATFQDAIFLTKHLGLRYLWIDSLCIIQDSPQDWLKEAASMPNIYRNSHITIAAAATESSTGGIFVDRSWLPTSRPCTLPVQVKSAESYGTVHFDVPFDANPQGIETNYLRTRAWCIQESLLSHRLLTFDTLQMSYTCVRENRIESRELPPALAREERNKFLEQFQAGASTTHQHDSQTLRSMIISWYDILYDYTRRDLTFSNDKLVAISGIASIVGTCIQDEYYAGLWRHDMPRALLWSPYEEETLPKAPHKSSLPPIYRAPSWSWAAVESPISCFLCRERLPNPPIAEVLDVGTKLVGEDVYGQVSEGRLVIRGPVKRAVVGVKSEVWPEQPLLRMEGWEEGDITHGVFDLEWLDEGTEVWCLQITAAYGLMLVKVGGEEDVFSRIGVFHLRHTWLSSPVWFTTDDVKTISII
ncbi:hypothetical protein ONS96_003867 [Cadophora gregata f. sp. sojae]|nr:hypothetical protein ONS96_003867 [Cadophora gregata f. sp. sojae]